MVFSELNHLNNDPQTFESISSRKKKNTHELPLTAEENNSLIKILDEAKIAEKGGDFSLATEKYKEYKEAFLSLKEEKKKSEVLNYEQQIEIIGKENFFGPKEIEEAFGFNVSESEIPVCPYTKMELAQAKERGEMLVLRVENDGEGKPLTMEHIYELAKVRVSGNLLSDKTIWYKNESFFKEEKLQTRWVLVSKECLKDSLGEDYVEQTRVLRNSLNEVDALTNEELEECSDENLDKIKEFMGEDYKNNWKKAAEQLANLVINKNYRRTSVEALYDFILRFKKTGERSLENAYDWTNTPASDGDLVLFGNDDFDFKGVSMTGSKPGYSHSHVGVVSSH